MGPHRYRGNRGGGVHRQRDTPVKAPLRRRVMSRRLLHKQRYETLPEEPEMEETDVPEVVSIKLVPCRSTREKLKDEALRAPQTSAQPDSPASPPMTPDPEASEPGHMTPPNLTVTLGSITSSATESDPAVSCDEEEKEEEEEEEASSVTPSSILPSPELLRGGGCVKTMTSFKQELLGLHLHPKNSTLLDVSQAESIRTHHSPNLSDIIETSAIQAERICGINKNRGPEAETQIHANLFKSENSFEWKTPPKVRKPSFCPSRENTTDRILLPRPIMYKKKVSFKVPVTAEASEPKLSTREERPASGATFFDFIDAADRDAFFEGLKTRREELRRVPLFPLTALEGTEAPRM